MQLQSNGLLYAFQSKRFGSEIPNQNKPSWNPAYELKKALIWNESVNRLAPELRPVVKTFGELVRQNSGAFDYTPRYPDKIEDVKRYPLPSNPEQMKLAEDLKKRLQALGLEASLDKHYNVIGKLESNVPKGKPFYATMSTVVLTAHLDTTYEQPNEDVEPQLHPAFHGQTLVVSEHNQKGQKVVLDPAITPALQARKGHNIITASGDTLLGADAKAGVAEILEALRQLKTHNEQHPTQPLYHPNIRVVFAVDEESNLLGARGVDLNALGADFGIDLDDTDPGKINVRSFNGHNVNVDIQGKLVHSAEADQMKMANAMMLASQIAAGLPKNQLLENKTGSVKGYLCLDQMQGDFNQARLLFLARDLKDEQVRKRVAAVIRQVQNVKDSAKNTPAQIKWRVEEEYQNPSIDSQSPFVKLLQQSARAVGIQPKITEFRGCTDAAVWSERGLPTVNLGCGWQNAHQLNEWVSAQDLYQMSQYLLKILTQWPEHGPRKPAVKNFANIAWPKITTG
jgi:tripeptide aminopeptidase